MWLTWFCFVAQAHVGDLIVALDLERGGSSSIDVEVSVGLTFWDGNEAKWICHEAITAPKVVRAPLYTRSTDDVRLGWLPYPEEGRDGSPLFRSIDGCDWTAVSEVTTGVRRASFTPDDPMRAWVLTVDGILWRSLDGGLTFADATPPAWTSGTDDIAFGTGGHVYISGADSSGLSGQIGVSADGGDTWQVFEMPIAAGLNPPVELRVLWVDPQSPQIALLSVDQIGADTLYRTEDGGQTWDPVYEAEITVVSVEQAPDGILYGVGGSSVLIRSVDGAQTWETANAPISLGLDVADGVLLAVNPEASEGRLVHRWEDGAGTNELALWEVTGPLECPEGSHQSTVCVPLWDQLAPRLAEPEPVTDTGDTDSPPDDTGMATTTCGCSVLSSPSHGLWLLLLGGAARRSRRAGS